MNPKILDEDAISHDEEPPLIEIGTDSTEELAEARLALIDCAREQEFPPETAHALRVLVEGHSYVFKIRLSENPANVEPLQIHMNPDVKPTVAAPRRQTPRLETTLVNTNQRSPTTVWWNA